MLKESSFKHMSVTSQPIYFLDEWQERVLIPIKWSMYYLLRPISLILGF